MKKLIDEGKLVDSDTQVGFTKDGVASKEDLARIARCGVQDKCWVVGLTNHKDPESFCTVSGHTLGCVQHQFPKGFRKMAKDVLKK